MSMNKLHSEVIAAHGGMARWDAHQNGVTPIGYQARVNCRRQSMSAPH
jgi:hypothetical protein